MRSTITVVACAALAAAGLGVANGNAQTTEGRTLTLFQDVAHEKNALVDNSPKSPAKNPDSRRFRLSLGDELVARTPVLDRNGGKRVGMLFAKATVVDGKRFENAVLEAQAVLVLSDGTITFAGLAGAAERPLAVIGGTGAYEGARGSATETETNSGADLKIHLLP